MPKYADSPPAPHHRHLHGSTTFAKEGQAFPRATVESPDIAIFLSGSILGAEHFSPRDAMLRIFFGHPINICNTELKARLLRAIDRRFPREDIVDPNEWRHQNAAGKLHIFSFRTRHYTETLARVCDVGVFLPFSDGTWHPDTADQIQAMIEADRIVFMIDQLGFMQRITTMDKVVSMSINEARARMFDTSGNPLPY